MVRKSSNIEEGVKYMAVRNGSVLGYNKEYDRRWLFDEKEEVEKMVKEMEYDQDKYSGESKIFSCNFEEEGVFGSSV